MNKTIKAVLATVASAVLAAPAASASDDLFQRLSMEGVNLVGGVTWGQIDNVTSMESGFYLFGYDNKYAPDRTNPIRLARPLGGCAYNDGIVYSNEFDSRNTSVTPVWRTYDAATFKLLSEHALSDNCNSTTSGITYDATTGNIYGFNETYLEYYVVKINPATGEMTRLGDALDRTYRYLGIACSPKGELYCTYIDKETDTIYLGKIRKTDGKIAKVGVVSATNLFDGDIFINSAYDQAMFYNHSTGKLYWMFQSSSAALYQEITSIYELNTTTCEAKFVAYMPFKLDAPGAFFVEPRLKAPAIIDGFDWKADADGSADGTVSITLPTKAYDLTPLSAPLRLVAVAAGDTVVNVTAEPGSTYTKRLTDLPHEWQEWNVTVENAVGAGPTVQRRFFAGYDMPKAPTNIRLVQDGLHTKLTWDAPTEGANGMPINKDNLRYRVVRYPYEVTVAEAQDSLSFEEDHPAEMTRYVYAVCAVDGDMLGKSAFSNNLIVGTPLDVPYGGEFTSPFDVFNYYTVVDANHDNITWTYDTSSHRAYYAYTPYNDADDWLISPPINYKKGKTYQLKFVATSSMADYPEDMDVTFGAGRTPEEQSKTLLTLRNIPNDFDEMAPDFYSTLFTVPEDGVYYYGFHAITPKYHEILWLSDISVSEYDPSGVEETLADGGVTVASADGAIDVTAAQPTRVTITDMCGRVVAQGTGKSLHAPLKGGVYVVSAGGKALKVAVK